MVEVNQTMYYGTKGEILPSDRRYAQNPIIQLNACKQKTLLRCRRILFGDFITQNQAFWGHFGLLKV